MARRGTRGQRPLAAARPTGPTGLSAALTGRLRAMLGHRLSRADHALYDAVAGLPTPVLDKPVRFLSRAANQSRIWLVIAGGIAALGGPGGRRAAVHGVVAIGLTSATVNIGFKSLYPRQRPDRAGALVPGRRQVRMPSSTSFPSGHSASAFAFATAVGRDLPRLRPLLRLLAATVAYSRVYTGVHYPGDVVIGSVIGTAIGRAVATPPP